MSLHADILKTLAELREDLAAASASVRQARVISDERCPAMAGPLSEAFCQLASTSATLNRFEAWLGAADVTQALPPAMRHEPDVKMRAANDHSLDPEPFELATA